MKYTLITTLAFSLSFSVHAMDSKGAHAIAKMKVLNEQASDLVAESWNIANSSSLPFYTKKAFTGRYSIGLLTKVSEALLDAEIAMDQIQERQKFWFFNPDPFEEIKPNEPLSCRFAMEQKTRDLVHILTYPQDDSKTENYNVDCRCNMCPHSLSFIAAVNAKKSNYGACSDHM